jgi:hypothetical protein
MPGAADAYRIQLEPAPTTGLDPEEDLLMLTKGPYKGERTQR